MEETTGVSVRTGMDDVDFMQEPKAPMITKIIGATIYEVVIHFSKSNTEILTGMIMRLVQSECSYQNNTSP